MLKKFVELFRAASPEGLSQQEKEASVDLLALLMFADRHIAESEDAVLCQEAKEIGWEDFDLQFYLQTSIAKARQGHESPEALDKIVASILERLPRPEIRQQAYDACERVASADSDRSVKEVQLLDKLRALLH